MQMRYIDDSKSELIHFESKKIMSTNSITLSNETILKFQNLSNDWKYKLIEN